MFPFGLDRENYPAGLSVYQISGATCNSKSPPQKKYWMDRNRIVLLPDIRPNPSIYIFLINYIFVIQFSSRRYEWQLHIWRVIWSVKFGEIFAALKQSRCCESGSLLNGYCHCYGSGSSSDFEWCPEADPKRILIRIRFEPW